MASPQGPSISRSKSPATADRAALALVQLGVLAVVLVALPYKTFDLDRYFVPKELVLHLCAAAAAICCLVPRRPLGLARLDWLLLGFLALSTASAIGADNRWLSTRALAISISGALLFWTGRSLRRQGLARGVVWAVAIGGAVGAVTALAQAYGITSDYLSLNRSPGGTFGNRNFMAHLAAIATPAIVYCALTARRSATALFAGICLGVVAAAEVLSRSRAAWLALLAAAVPAIFVAWLTRRRWITPETSRRLGVLGTCTVIAVAAALLLPNTLEWKSDSPYLESVRGMVNYQQGSGKGRLVQYGNSLRMMTTNPILGVGPGNWSVEYPRYASRSDPSMSTTDDGTTANPWPSSDWVAFAAERGAPAAMLLALFFIALLGLAAWNTRVARGADALLGALALAATVIVTLVVGSFDAVLLLAPPALFVWSLLGALAEPASPTAQRRPVSEGVRRWLGPAVLAFGVLAAARGATQIAAMKVANGTSKTGALSRASQLDPGNFRVRMHLAEAYKEAGHCERARPEARDARELLPMAEAPRQLLAACGESSPKERRR